jgi:hypothetical protein
MAIDLGTAPSDLGSIVFQPAAVWISSGGGVCTAPSGGQLNLSIGGTSFVGTGSATSTASVSFGFLDDDTF